MTLTINGESIIMFLAPDAISPYGIGALWAVIVGMAVVVVLFLRIGNTIFNREELLGRNLDSMNIFGTLRKIGRYVRAIDDRGTPARNLLEWYTKAIPYSLRKYKSALLVTLLVSLVAFVGGFAIGLIPQWRVVLPQGTLSPKSADIIRDLLTPTVQNQAFIFILTNNLRVLLAATILAFFSFGVMALVMTPTVYVVLGYIFSQLILSGSDLTVYLVALIPHGIVELPTVLLGTAIAFRLGAVSTRPPQGDTVGHAVVVTMGDTIKLTIGVIIPCLIIAALIEAYVTFPLVQMVMQH
jgi:stage II sporulation protein M